MRYMMKQKLFALGDNFYIKDESGQDRFLVDAKVFTLGNKLSFQDLAGNELCFIKQVPFSPLARYELFKGTQLWAAVEKELTFFRAWFDIIGGPGTADLQVEGDFMGHEYTFTRGLTKVANVSMKYFTLADAYSIDIVDGEEDILVLASTVVIDIVCHSGGHFSVPPTSN